MSRFDKNKFQDKKKRKGGKEEEEDEEGEGEGEGGELKGKEEKKEATLVIS